MAKVDLALRLGCVEAAASLVASKMERGVIPNMDDTAEVIKKAEVLLAWITKPEVNQPGS